MAKEKMKELTKEELNYVVGGVGNNEVKKPELANNVPLVAETNPTGNPPAPEDSNPVIGPFFG